MLIHIGYHKTGSTWLQRTLFPSASAGLCQPWSMPTIAERFILANRFTFDPALVRSLHEPEREEAARAGLVPVLSHERLAGNFVSGGFDARLIADALHATFPEARVLLLFREQVGMVLSGYKQYVRGGGVLSLKRFMHIPNRGRAAVPGFDPRFFEYDLLVRYYRSLFGPENVLALPHELMRADLQGVSDRIRSFVGKDEPWDAPSTVINPGLSGLTAAIKRRLNGPLVLTGLNRRAFVESRYLTVMLRERFNQIDRLTPKPVRRWFDARMRAMIEHALAGRYGDSNARLADMIKIDLAPLGYEVS